MMEYIIILNFGMHVFFSSLSDFPVQTSMSQRWKKNPRQQNVCAIHDQDDEVFCERNNAKKKPPAQFSPGIHNLTLNYI